MSAPTSPIATQGSPARQETVGRSTASRPDDRVVVLTDADVAEVLAARDAVRRASLPLLVVGRADFPLPTLGRELARLAEDLDSHLRCYFASLSSTDSVCNRVDAALLENEKRVFVLRPLFAQAPIRNGS